jgi:hypothetical protein
MTHLIAPDGTQLVVTPVDAEVGDDAVRLTVEVDASTWQRVRAEQLFHLDAEHAPSLPASAVDTTYRLVLRLGIESTGDDLERDALLTELPARLSRTEDWYAEDVQREIAIPEALQVPGARLAEGSPTGWAPKQRPSTDAPLLTIARTWFAEHGMAATGVDDATVLRLDGDGFNGSWVLWLETREDEGIVLVWSSWPEAVPAERRRAVMELLTRLNTDIAVGAFEMDLDRGQVSFRTSIDVTDDRLSGALLSRLVGANVEVFDDWLPALQSVIAGRDAQVVLAELSR